MQQKTMILETIKKPRYRGLGIIHTIWMFPNWIQSKEDVESAIVVIDLVYSTIFQSISPFLDLDKWEGWIFLSLKSG